MALTKLNNNSLHAITDGSALKNVTGTVLQTVTADIGGSAVTTTSSSHVTSGKSATITPKSSSSKIIIQLHLGDTAADNNHAGTGVALYRGSTRVATLNSRHAYSVSGSNPSGLGIAGLSPIWFDSPATTNATTYTVYFDNGGAGTATLFRDGTDGCIVLQEIAG